MLFRSTTTAHCRREDPWSAIGELLSGAARTLGMEPTEEQIATWSKAGSRDNYAELLTGRAAAMYYGILPIPDPLPTDNAHPALRAVLVDPKQPLAQWTWARWQASAPVDAGHAPEALARASLLRPSSPLFPSERAWLLSSSGHAEEALLIWQDLVEHAPNDPRFLEPYARALLTAGQIGRAHV